jgi:isopentenyl diphosphate isomerase/L-lactate dehydrogenase-like FMN-dependent dehydrogenase
MDLITYVLKLNWAIHISNCASLSLNENETAYDRYKIRPRILKNVDKIDTTTEILGSKVRTKTSILEAI